MGAINRVAPGAPLQLKGVQWWRVWRVERPTAVVVDGEAFAVNAGDALQAGPSRQFRNVEFAGTALVEHSNDPAEVFPGAVLGAAGVVMLDYADDSGGVLVMQTGGNGTVDVSAYREVVIEAYLPPGSSFAFRSAYAARGAGGEDDGSGGYTLVQPGLVDPCLLVFGWPLRSATPIDYSAAIDGTTVRQHGMSVPLPQRLGFHVWMTTPDLGAWVRMWGRR